MYKYDEHDDGALLALSDWWHQLAAWAASVRQVKQKIVEFFFFLFCRLGERRYILLCLAKLAKEDFL